MSATTLTPADFPTRRRWMLLTWIALVVVTASAAFWAGQVTARPAVAVTERPDPVTYTVASDTVAQVMGRTAAGSWPDDRQIFASRVGTVTSIDLPPDGWVKQGQVLATIDLNPLVIASGPVPMFREITAGTAGPDVRQLQTLLQDNGFGPSASGVVDEQTIAAIKGWQQSLGRQPTGTVALGDIFFLPRLPVRARLAPEAAVGTVMSGPRPIAITLAAEPRIILSIPSEQTRNIPTSGPVQLSYDGKTWSGRMAEGTLAANGALELPLVAADGSPICGTECAVIKVGEPNFIPVSIVVVPSTTGPAVPAAAIMTEPDGTTYVTRADSSRQRITVRAAANGIAVVDGIAIGDQVLLSGISR